VGDVLDAAAGADEEKAEALASVALDPEARSVVVEAARDLDEAAPPEPELEGDEEDSVEMADDGEPEKEPAEAPEGAAETAPVAETPEK
jgi:hypothetical protein